MSDLIVERQMGPQQLYGFFGAETFFRLEVRQEYKRFQMLRGSSASQFRSCIRERLWHEAAMIWRLNWRTEWWARRDSNPQPSGYEPPALTIELQAPRGLD